MSEPSFTGYQRARKTRLGVRASEIGSRSIITVGGIGVIAAVFLVFVFLASVVFPLARRTRTEDLYNYRSLAVSDELNAAFLAADEFLIAGFKGQDGGRSIRHFLLDTGEVLEEIELFRTTPSAVSYTQTDGWLAAGFDDGSTILGQVVFETRYYENEDVDPALRTLEEGSVGVLDGNAVQRTPVGQLRQQALVVRMDEPIPRATASPIVLIDKTIRSSGPVLSTLSADGMLQVDSVNRRRNILTGAVTTTTTGGAAQVPGYSVDDPPVFMLITSIADAVYLVWSDGRYVRFDTRDLADLRVAERGTLLDTGDRGVEITTAAALIGRGTLLVGDSAGRVRTWFRVRSEDAGTPDGMMLVNADEFEGSAPVTRIASSARKRLMAVGYGDGSVRTFYVTSSASLAEAVPFDGSQITGIAISPRDDALVVTSAEGLAVIHHDAPHPEATIRAIFGKVWYEGNPEPEHAWQSSSSTDTFEPKLGLMPLIFGTLKATIFSMLFGVPIALLAAIYTSEFLDPRLRARIKPAIEMMASLPSVVLGFLAALVFAPFVEGVVPTILVSFILVPVSFLLGGYLYQLLPRRTGVILSRYRFFIITLVVVPAGILLSVLAGPLFERLFFSGDIKSWLDGQIGTGTGGWVLILLPASAFLVAFIMGRTVSPRLRDVYQNMDDRQVSRLELAKFAAGVLAAVGVALAAGWLLTLAGLDSRASFPVIGPVLGTYVQRNSLIVGFIMGFAIIPIIYTISDDALRSVPDHLRSASLACGATPWQTTMRVIIPTAMSGLFSAVMIGLGRAVGETMIVLMAAGNTPIMEMNIFNGFRTLAANIAVELPEAVLDSTHYRILFLAALVLFVMTFIVNTIAETVRQRFRRRAYQL